MSGWRVARSLEILRAEINTAAPGRSTAADGSIGDAAHAGTASDHNINPAGVVCARDFTHDPGSGADMHLFSRAIVATLPTPLKYVIWDRHIWSRSRAAEGWRPYNGSNPHTKHMHVSVGRGPDGRSTGPYDDTSPWGIRGTGIGGIMLPQEGDKGPIVEFWQRTLRRTGEEFPKFGADGHWGAEMTAAVQSSRKRLGWEPVAKPRITAAHAEQLFAKAYGGTTGATDAQVRAAVESYLQANPPRDGKDGKTPTKIRLELTGDVIGTE